MIKIEITASTVAELQSDLQKLLKSTMPPEPVLDPKTAAAVVLNEQVLAVPGPGYTPARGVEDDAPVPTSKVVTTEPKPAKKTAPKKESEPEQTKLPPAGSYDGPPVPEEIRSVSSMKDLLQWLVSKDGGKVTDIDKLSAACVALKDQVPILTKVPDVDSRVRRAAEVLGLFEPVPE